MSSDGLGSPPNSPLTGVTLDSGDVVLKVQQGHLGAELGHRSARGWRYRQPSDSCASL